jgi:hypothetical protein
MYSVCPTAVRIYIECLLEYNRRASGENRVESRICFVLKSDFDCGCRRLHIGSFPEKDQVDESPKRQREPSSVLVSPVRKSEEVVLIQNLKRKTSGAGNNTRRQLPVAKEDDLRYCTAY